MPKLDVGYIVTDVLPKMLLDEERQIGMFRTLQVFSPGTLDFPYYILVLNDENLGVDLLIEVEEDQIQNKIKAIEAKYA